MKRVTFSQNRTLTGIAFTGAVASVLLIAGCVKDVDSKALKDFQQVVIVANNASYGPITVDTAQQNTWGLAFSPGGIAWINANAGHVSSLYTVSGTAPRAAVNIPGPGGEKGTPTGIVFNSGAGFALPTNHAKAAFIFVGDDGVLSAWNGPAGNNAVVIKDNSANSSYFGLAILANGGQNFLYAANFKTGKIDAWDTSWNFHSLPFHDPGLPNGYSPFNIQAIGNWLFVMYAKKGPSGDELHQEGLGLVDVFNPDGSFVKRFASKGTLNAPWGIAEAPATFLQDMDTDGDNKNQKDGDGKDKGHNRDSIPVILVGNFGDGRINAYSLDGTFLGQLKSHNRTIVIDGLWALQFAPSTATAINPNWLFFTAGPKDETDGEFGYITKQ